MLNVRGQATPDMVMLSTKYPENCLFVKVLGFSTFVFLLILYSDRIYEIDHCYITYQVVHVYKKENIFVSLCTQNNKIMLFIVEFIHPQAA
jgi:hypothetical protein